MNDLETRVTTLEKRVDELTTLLNNAFGNGIGGVDPITQPPPTSIVVPFKRKPYATTSYKKMHFFYKSPGFTYMQDVVNDLSLVLASKCTPSNDVNIWIDFTSGSRFTYPEFEQFPSGRKNFFIILSYGSDVNFSSTDSDGYRFDIQVNLKLTDNVKSIDYSKSHGEIDNFCNAMKNLMD